MDVAKNVTSPVKEATGTPVMDAAKSLAAQAKEAIDTPKMDAYKDILLGRWVELKGQVRSQWGKITENDVTQLTGKTEELAGVLQQRYGYEKAKAEAEIAYWLRAHDQHRKA